MLSRDSRNLALFQTVSNARNKERVAARAASPPRRDGLRCRSTPNPTHTLPLIMKRTLTTAVALVLSAHGVASAQGGWNPDHDLVLPPVTSDDLFIMENGSPVSVVTPDVLQVGRLTGEVDVDGMFLSDGTVRFLYGVGSFEVTTTVATMVSSATIQRGRTAGGYDVILASSASGLDQYEYEPLTGAFSPPTNIKSSNLFQSISILEEADLDQTGPGDIIFVPNATPKLVQGWSALAGGGLQTEFFFFVPRVVVALADMDWDADGDTDIVVLSTDALRIYDQSGTLLIAFPAAVLSLDGAICVLEGTTAQPDDRLVWARRDATNSFFEMLVLHTSATSPPALKLEFALGSTLGAEEIDVVGLSPGDCDGDGDLDILISQTTFSAGVLLGNRGASTPLFSTGMDDYRSIALTDTPEASGVSFVGPGLLADINSDGRADIFYPNPGADKISVHCSAPGFPFGGGTPLAASSTGGMYQEVAYGAATLITDPGGPILSPCRIRLDVPDSLISNSDFTHIQLVIWRQATTGSPLFGDSVANYFYPIPTTLAPNLQLMVDELDAALDWPTSTTLPAGMWTLGLNFFLSVRLVEADSSLEVVGAHSHWFVNAFTVDPDLDDDDDNSLLYKDYLKGLAHIQGEADLERFDPSGIQPEGFALGLTTCLGRFGNFGANPMYGTKRLKAAGITEY